MHQKSLTHSQTKIVTSTCDIITKCHVNFHRKILMVSSYTVKIRLNILVLCYITSPHVSIPPENSKQEACS